MFPKPETRFLFGYGALVGGYMQENPSLLPKMRQTAKKNGCELEKNKQIAYRGKRENHTHLCETEWSDDYLT
jgi:hypothetical protein